jgi:hypothetical protein
MGNFPIKIWSFSGFNFWATSVFNLYQWFNELFTTLYSTYVQGRRSHGGNWPRCRNSAGAARGQQLALFHQNCTSKFVRYSHELEFITIFKQCLSNLCLILTSYSKINARGRGITLKIWSPYNVGNGLYRVQSLYYCKKGTFFLAPQKGIFFTFIKWWGTCPHCLPVPRLLINAKSDINVRLLILFCALNMVQQII